MASKNAFLWMQTKKTKFMKKKSKSGAVPKSPMMENLGLTTSFSKLKHGKNRRRGSFREITIFRKIPQGHGLAACLISSSYCEHEIASLLGDNNLSPGLGITSFSRREKDSRVEMKRGNNRSRFPFLALLVLYRCYVVISIIAGINISGRSL